MKILFVSASPSGMDHLRSDKELREIQDRLRRSKQGADMDLVVCSAATPRHLRDALQQHAPEFVHFSGHGTAEEGLLFEDDQEQQHPVTQRALAGLFAAFKHCVRLVVLNACHSAAEAKAIAEHIEYAVGMKGWIADKVAIVFAATFYESLAYGRSIQDAFDLANNALSLEGMVVDDLPQLYVRPVATGQKLQQSSQQTGNIHDRQPVVARRKAPTRPSLRKLMAQVLPDDGTFNAFCLDHFASVYRRFSGGMDRIAKENLLLQVHKPVEILVRLRQNYPDEVAEHESLLIDE